MDFSTQINAARILQGDTKLRLAMDIFRLKFGGNPPVFEYQAHGFDSDAIAEKLLDSVEAGKPLSCAMPEEKDVDE